MSKQKDFYLFPVLAVVLAGIVFAAGWVGGRDSVTEKKPSYPKNMRAVELSTKNALNYGAYGWKVKSSNIQSVTILYALTKEKAVKILKIRTYGNDFDGYTSVIKAN